VKLIDFEQTSLDAANALAELAVISLQEYDHRVEIVRDRAVARCSDALSVADAWRDHPGEREAVAAYLSLSTALDLTDMLWWLFEAQTREQDKVLAISRKLTHMRGILTESSAMARALGAALDDMAPEEWN
jgi:hypothetical protein